MKSDTGENLQCSEFKEIQTKYIQMETRCLLVLVDWALIILVELVLLYFSIESQDTSNFA